MTQMVRLIEHHSALFRGSTRDFGVFNNFLKGRNIHVQAQLNFERNFKIKKYNTITSDNIEIKMSV